MEEIKRIGETKINHYLATSMADGRVLMTGGQTLEGNPADFFRIALEPNCLDAGKALS